MKTVQNDEKFTIWTILNVYRNDGTEYSELDINYEFIEQLPVPVKTIIARYTSFLPDYLLDKETESKLAKALGGFSSLKQARKTLLKDWKGKDMTIITDFPAYLGLKETTESLFFEYAAMYGIERITDEFKIDENGKITYLKKPEPIDEIPYNRETLFEKCRHYRFQLNGKPVEYFFLTLYLDPDNVKSVKVNTRDEIVYIEQKNKKTKYFVHSDLNRYIDSFEAFKVKNINEISCINIADEVSQLNEFYDDMKIEESYIERIIGYVAHHDDYDEKCVMIILKNAQRN